MEKSLTDEDSLLACPKHFVAYGAAMGGMDYNTVEMSEQTLHEVYLPPFKAAFDAGALSTMSSFNDIERRADVGQSQADDRAAA